MGVIADSTSEPVCKVVMEAVETSDPGQLQRSGGPRTSVTDGELKATATPRRSTLAFARACSCSTQRVKT